MKKRQGVVPVELAILDGVNRKLLLEFLQEGDGHSIYDPARFLEMGFHKSFVEGWTSRFGDNANGDPKAMVFKDGVRVHPVGVYGLDVVRRIADAYSIRSFMYGRGSEARDLGTQLIAKLGLK